MKRLTGLGSELKLVWIPSGSSNFSGMVKKDRIYICDEDPREAAETLIEEFVEYGIADASRPSSQYWTLS